MKYFMDSILSTIYLKVKSEARTLTNCAIAQILVKIIYSSEKRLLFSDIISLYKNFTKRKLVDENTIHEILEKLCSTNEIKQSAKKEYYLTESKRKQIDSVCEMSKKRRDEIIKHYFSSVYSDNESVSLWLQDVSLHFFQYFSEEWISDLLKTSDAIIHSKNSIFEMITKRTENIKNIDKRDYQILPKLFINFLSSKDSDVIAYLWEYGTSAFSAKLISNTVGVDALTLDIFKGAKCLLDTNILIFIKLDSSKYHKALISLEKSFQNLGMEVGVLHITKEEYQHKIDHQKQLTIRNYENMGFSLMSKADDDFTQMAISLLCRTKEDFELFFNKLRELPKYVNNSLIIKEIDNSTELINDIGEAQINKSKINNLNCIYREATGKDKKALALTHDVGLIAGVEHLRRNEKWFILSEEISVNNYSKTKPVINGLPVSVRVSTLINVLALNSGGDCFEANDYMQLFASIIQNEFQPSKETFAQEDLYAIYNLNHQISLLPDDVKHEIVMNIQAQRLKGEKDETLKIELERAITRGKLQLSDDLNNTRIELFDAKKEVARQQSRGDRITQALYLQIQKDVISDYNKKICLWIFVPLFGIPVVVIFILSLCNYISLHFDKSGQSIGFIINIIAGLALDLIYFMAFGIKKIASLIKGKSEYIKLEIERRMHNALKDV